MNKLGIWAIAIAGAFLIGVLSANPIVEAQSGWKAAVAELQEQIPPPTYWVIEDDLAFALDALCDPGDRVIGGGTTVLFGATEVRVGEPIFNSGPNSDQEGWKGEIRGGGAFEIRTSASCLDLPPLRP